MSNQKYKSTTAIQRLSWALEALVHFVATGSTFSAKNITDQMRADHPGYDIPHDPQRGLTWALFHGHGNMTANPASELFIGKDRTDKDGNVFHEFTARPIPLHPLVERFFKSLVSGGIDGKDYDDGSGWAQIPTSVISRWASANGLKDEDKGTFKADLKTGAEARGGSFYVDGNDKKFLTFRLYDPFLDEDEEDEFEDDDLFDDDDEDGEEF